MEINLDILMKNLDIVQTIKRVSSSVFFFFFFACMLMVPDITVGDITVGPSKFHCVYQVVTIKGKTNLWNCRPRNQETCGTGGT